MEEPWARTETGISDREAELLRLVAAHLSNAQIANRLVISARTVESHVSSLLRKLDVASRHELALLFVPREPVRGRGTGSLHAAGRSEHRLPDQRIR